METYPNNSNAFKEDKKEVKIEKVVTGPISIKKNAGRQILDSILPGNKTDLKTLIIKDTLLPGVKKILYDALSGVLNGLFGINSKPFYGQYDNPSYKYQYAQNPYGGPEVQRSPVPTTRVSDDWNHLVAQNRQDLEAVKQKMIDAIGCYGVVRVSDYYEFAGIPHDNYTDNDYGWNNLESAYVYEVPGGYMLHLPKALPIRMR